jgi:ubiquitin carboxyl-terminal hydrolase 2/21
MEQFTISLSDKGVKGINNIGNTCYLNTALQCLGHCIHFLQYVMSFQSSDDHPLMQHLRDIYITLWLKQENVAPSVFCRILQKRIKSIFLQEQNDISEFLSILLDKLNQDICQNMRDDMKRNLQMIHYNSTSYDIQRRKMDLDWIEKVGKEYSPICNMLYGQHISQIICNHCKKVWHNYEVFQNISVALSHDNLYDCIKHHFEDLRLHDWQCDNCKKGKSSVQTTLFWRNPSILVVSLKRFDFKKTGHIEKNNTQINVPEVLDISKFTVGRNTNTMYSLKSVAFHSGSYFGGHYNAICKHPNNTWYMMDDEMVMKVSDVNMPDVSTGYVFFYESVR